MNEEEGKRLKSVPMCFGGDNSDNCRKYVNWTSVLSSFFCEKEVK
jgi:hypothetical protein